MESPTAYDAGRIQMTTETAMATLARMAEVMATQQHEVTLLLQHQQAVLEKMNVTPSKEKRVEGISMPTFHGRVGESLHVFLQQGLLYFRAKNIDMDDPANQARLIAMMASNLKGQAAAFYTFHQGKFKTLNELAEALQDEFIPADWQERLRSELMQLKQIRCENLEDYICKFRHIICQVRDMSEIDQITWFVHGLVTRTREEVAYRRCATLSKAISVALEYERAHANGRNDRHDARAARERPPDTAEPMEIDNVNLRTLSRDECRRRNLCFRCKRPGHRMNECRVRAPAPRGNQHGRSRGRRSINAVTIGRVPAPSSQQDPPPVFPGYSINMVRVMVPTASPQENSLIRKTVRIGDHRLVALIDCGANHNLIRPGIVSGPSREHVASVESFDGHLRPNMVLREVTATVSMDKVLYGDVNFTEFDLPASHDLILGKPWLTRFNPNINWRTHAIQISSFDMLDLRDGYQCIPMHESNVSLYHVKITAIDDEAVHPTEIEALLGEFKDVFPDVLPSGLPPERSVEFELNMKPDAHPSSRAPFRQSKAEQEALQVFVNELLEKQWIELSDSPWVSNVFGVPKRDPKTGERQTRSDWVRNGGLHSLIRWVVDYRYLNSQTLVPKIPLPNIEELFDLMAAAVVFSVIDLAQGYHQMRVKPSSRPYTAFRTATETYHWCVAPMGVAGMPGVWSRLMRVLFGKYDFVVVYLDDICVFSKTIKDHEQHLRTVFDVLRAEKLYARKSKCSFARESVDFLGHTISKDGLHVDKKKTMAIERWPAPTTVKELQSFLGLAGYYRRFIHRFADVVLPLSDLVKKDKPWSWNAYQENAFLVIKAALQQAPVLRLPDFSQPFVVTTDASRTCCGGVLSQRFEGFDHPVAFYSKKLGQHELNWPAHEKELFAIKLALSKWRHYLHGRHFDVYTDNIACRWFLNHPTVSPKLARWLDFFSQFDFELHHVKGVQNIVADALSRHIPVEPTSSTAVHGLTDRHDEGAEQQSVMPTALHVNSVIVHECTAACHAPQRLIRDRQHVMNELASCNSYDLHLLLDDQSRGVGSMQGQRERVVKLNATEFRASSVHLAPRVRDELAAGYRSDPVYSNLQDGDRTETSAGELYCHDGLVFLKTDGQVHPLCVPVGNELRTTILAEFHDSAAHPGVPRTLAKLKQWYYWNDMETDVNDYVQSCLTCHKFKVSSTRKKGKLIPLEVPTECWEHVGLDYITGLPASNGYDCIQVAVDLLSKRAKYAPMVTTADAAECARVFFDSVVRHHGVPRAIVSDRDSRFTGAFWQALMKIMGVRLHMTTSHRAQADGQVERQNRVLEDSLRCLSSEHGSNWAELLGTIEYAHSTLMSASTGLSPFEIDNGRQPRHPGTTMPSRVPETRVRSTKAEFAQRFAASRRTIVERAQQALLDAKAKQKRYYDKRRAEPDFKAGDLVLLKTEHLSLKQVAHDTQLKKAKLKAQAIGPFAIEYMVNENVARLKLPRQLRRLHPSFNVELLEPYPEQLSRFKTRPQPKATPVELADDEGDDGLRVIERLLARRQFNRKPEFLVQWLGEPESESTWERERDIRHVVHWPRLLQELRERERAKRTSTAGECQLPRAPLPRRNLGLPPLAPSRAARDQPLDRLLRGQLRDQRQRQDERRAERVSRRQADRERGLATASVDVASLAPMAASGVESHADVAEHHWPQRHMTTRASARTSHH